MALQMSNQINEAENTQRNKASATAQIHRTQAHTPSNRTRGGGGGGGGIALKPRRQQILIPIYTVKLSKLSHNTKAQFSGLWHTLTLE